MNASLRPVAVDMGSSSVRIIAGDFDGSRLTLNELARFPHAASSEGGRLVWALDDLLAKVTEVVEGLARTGELTSVGIDSWGVDHVLVDAAGDRVAPAFSYRDTRTQPVVESLARRGIDAEWLWQRTGSDPAPILTAFQLVATAAEMEPGDLRRVSKVLMLSDYVASRLGAEAGWSQGICSTTGLTRPGGTDWAHEVLDVLDIPQDWFGPISAERTLAGHLGAAPAVPIVRAGSHDTACAVHALPGTTGPRAFLASGSWSLLGLETDSPVLDLQALEAGMTNEGRTDGGNRLLHNLTGLWIVQECARQWEREGLTNSWQQLTAAAERSTSRGLLLDLDDPELQTPGDMPSRIRQAARRAGGTAPRTPGEVMRVVLESLASRYAAALDELTSLTGVAPQSLAVVGGGSRQTLLNQLTADACGLPLLVGTPEATSMGSLLAQLEAVGEIDPSDRDAVVAASCDIVTVEPRTAWHDRFAG